MQFVSRRGDTLIEVMFSITVFAVIAVVSVGLMNGGIYTAQKSLEVGMARNEIDAQAEALRFIQNGYLADRSLESGGQEFRELWERLTDAIALRPDQVNWNGDGVNSDRSIFNINGLDRCADAYAEGGDGAVAGQVVEYRGFILNTRALSPDDGRSGGSDCSSYSCRLEDMVVGARRGDDGVLQAAALYPRILYDTRTGEDTEAMLENTSYTDIVAAEGIWVIAVRGGKNADADVSMEPEYFDFYIQTCWHSVGSRAPSTIGSIVRLYNPEMVE